jgi:hypothetical protein
MSMNVRISTLGLLVCGLAACGGGGGGGDATPGTGATVFPALALTPANAEAASGGVVTAGSETIGAGDVGSFIITGAVVDTGDRPALAELARWSLDTLYGSRDQLVASLSGVVVNETVACTSGSISLSWNDADDDGEFSSGDSFSITFNNCVEMDATFNGSLTMSGFTISGDPNVDIAWSMAATFTFTALTINDGGDSARVDGGMSFSIATLDSDDFEVELSGNSLAYREGTHTTTLRNFIFNYMEEISSGLYSLEYSGTVDIGSLSGRVSFETTTPFTGSDILDSWPSAGTLLITGANASTVTLEALGGDNVRLSIDSNGDSIVDEVIDTTWTELAAI